MPNSFLENAIQEALTEEENARLHLSKLKALDEKRIGEHQRLECYQAHLSRAFNKKILPRSFKLEVLCSLYKANRHHIQKG